MFGFVGGGAASALRITHSRQDSICSRRMPLMMAKKRSKKSGGAGDKKVSTSKTEEKNDPQHEKLVQDVQADVSASAPEFLFEGPLAPADETIDTTVVEEKVTDASLDDQQDKQVMNLPAQPTTRRRRQRRRKSKPQSEAEEVTVTPAQVDVVERNVSELTKGFRNSKDNILEQIEIDPDYVLRRNDERKRYDLTSALLGEGQRTQNFGNVLPYLQSGHLVMLLVMLLSVYVYYPGFPLTELPENIRDSLRKGIFITFFVNSILCIRAYIDAKALRQSAAFWIVKVFFLGGLALNELQVNVPDSDA